MDKHIGAYLPPDSVVDVTRPEFSFLASGTKTKHRIKAVKLRGVQSFGLLMPAPYGSLLGDDVAEYYGVEHYEPEMRGLCTGGEAEKAPPLLACLSKYDIDSLRRYNHIFQDGEEVWVTEKIHGANSRYAFADDRMWCGSRGEWKKQEDGSIWWRALQIHPEIEQFCKAHAGHVLYGEVYGKVQSLRYGIPGDVRFMAFDVLDERGQFWNAQPFRNVVAKYGVPTVPLIYVGPYSFDVVCALSEGPSIVAAANHIREGCVVKPSIDRWHQSVGRVVLKIVGAGYLEKS
jgi:RNA ligase (TIGR02306 family)